MTTFTNPAFDVLTGDDVDDSPAIDGTVVGLPFHPAQPCAGVTVETAPTWQDGLEPG
jgi:hypothetical protein